MAKFSRDDDEPRRPSESGGSSVLVLVLAAVAGVAVLLVGAGVAALFLFAARAEVREEQMIRDEVTRLEAERVELNEDAAARADLRPGEAPEGEPIPGPRAVDGARGGARPDTEAIRGAWRVVTAKETRGIDPNADIAEYEGSVWTFGETEFTVTKGKAETRLAYRLDPAKTPKEIDLGRDLAGKDEGRPFEGIYRLDGDRLTVCYTVFNVRPTDFGMGRGVASVKRLVVLERVKK